MHRFGLAVVPALALLGATACATDETGIQLHIESDLDAPSELAELRILIEPEGGSVGGGVGLDRTVVPGEDAELPIVIGIVPAGGDASRRVQVRVEATPGPEASVPLAPFDRVLEFEQDAVRDVYARFPASCALRGGTGCEEPCQRDDDCNDGIACTVDLCEAERCTHRPEHTLCDSGECDAALGCVGEGCVAAGCVAGPCEEAECVGGRCVVTTLCEEGQGCCAGECVPAMCDDDDECTADRCDDEMGCLHTPRTEDEEGREIPGCPAT